MHASPRLDSPNLPPPGATLLEPVAPAVEAGVETALDAVLRRMRATNDFPALSRAVSGIQRIAASDTESVASLSAEILKDVALTHKLLRMVNSVHFGGVGGGSINTVSRAVALVGFAGIRNMALSLVLLEGMQDKAQLTRLREEFVRSLVASQLARELTPWDADAEEAYLAALFHNLGRMLVEFYLPDEARVMARLCAAPSAPGAQPAMSFESAAYQVLGVGLETLSVGVAKSWGLPEELRRALRRPDGAAPGRAAPRGSERNRWLAALSNDLALAMQLPEPDAARLQVRNLASEYAGVLGLAAGDIRSAADKARQTVSQLAPAIGLPVLAGSPTQRLLSFNSVGPEAAATTVAAPAAVNKLSTDAAAPTLPTAPSATASAASGKSENADNAVSDNSEAAVELLAAGIQDVMTTLAADNFQLNVVLRMILETLLRALHLRRVVFCLRDPKTQHITGRFGLGLDADVSARKFVVNGKPETAASPDLFSLVCQKSVDTLIANAADANIRHRLPVWYRGELLAPSFLLLPLAMKGASFALIYADVAEAGSLKLGEREMALVRTLRNQAVMAFRQSA